MAGGVSRPRSGALVHDTTIAPFPPLALSSSSTSSSEQHSAEEFARKVLTPQVVEANRHGKFDRDILTGMGAAGLLGCTLKGYGCAGVGHVAYGLVARWVPPSGYFQSVSRVGSRFVGRFGSR